MQKMLKKENKIFLIGVFLGLTALYIALFTIERSRLSSFGCFDDCFNYTAAYFMLKGKNLYSEIFYNHQMLAAYLSVAIQKIFDPQSIYHMLVYHRMFLLLFSFVFNLLLIVRFRWPLIGFVLVYETTKIYVFGNRFLAESFIIYPIIYLLCLAWEQFLDKKLTIFDIIFSAFCAWAIIFMREPYILLAVFLYGVVIMRLKKRNKEKILSICILTILSVLTVLSVSIPDYIFNVFAANSAKTAHELQSQPIFYQISHVFLYPLVIFFTGHVNLLRIFLIGLSTVFCLGIYFSQMYKNFFFLLFIIVTLGLANTRSVPPGTMYYEAFHFVQWYGIFITITVLLIQKSFQYEKKIVYWLIAGLVLLWGYTFIHPQSYIWEKVNRQEEFVTNYGNYVSNGGVIKILKDENDTLFADQIDDLLYYTADIQPSYKYSWYFSVMPGFSKYTQARTEMFEKYPPDFYYGFCQKPTHKSLYLEKKYESEYSQLYFSTKPTCLYVRKNKIQTISAEKWDKVKDQFGYYLPDTL